MIDWTQYPNFSKHEFDCQETGENGMQARFLDVLQAIRTDLNHPIKVTSGYRSPRHSLEAAKSTPGEHAMGLCADVWVPVIHLHALLQLAFLHGVTRIGVSHGNGAQFIHLGVGTEEDGLPSPRIWSY